MLLAIKRLAQVEVAQRATRARIKAGAPRSNQHEFNAGRLRSNLGFGTRPVNGSLRFLYFIDDGADPVTDETTFTLYNAREGKPRAPEYRLYYHSTRLNELAEAGDLFVLFRPDETASDLVGVVARAGSATERELLRVLEVDPEAAAEKFVFREPKPIDGAGVESLYVATGLFDSGRAASEHPLLADAIRAGVVPTPERISSAAHDTVLAAYGELDPDSFITRSVNEESALYFSIEGAVKERQLQKMIESGSATLSNILQFSLSVHQSRRARRGQSLQFHFEALLRRERIPFTAQCLTENREKPDIIVPGRAQYADKSFPDNLLRMVACKSTVRERWSQLSREAARIREKYLLTLDDGLSGEVIKNMTQNHSLMPFVPRSIKTEHYASQSAVRTVKDLLGELEDAVAQARKKGKLRRSA